jgi:nicotinate phosphoribosyltransferase
MFCDNLDFETAIDLHETLSDMINITFGVGRDLTHDVGIIPLQMRFNLVECNGGPVARISDDINQLSCPDPRYLTTLKEVFGIED